MPLRQPALGRLRLVELRVLDSEADLATMLHCVAGVDDEIDEHLLAAASTRTCGKPLADHDCESDVVVDQAAKHRLDVLNELLRSTGLMMLGARRPKARSCATSLTGAAGRLADLVELNE